MNSANLPFRDQKSFLVLTATNPHILGRRLYVLPRRNPWPRKAKKSPFPAPTAISWRRGSTFPNCRQVIITNKEPSFMRFRETPHRFNDRLIPIREENQGVQNSSECPLWVISGLFAATLRMMAHEYIGSCLQQIPLSPP